MKNNVYICPDCKMNIPIQARINHVCRLKRLPTIEPMKRERMKRKEKIYEIKKKQPSKETVMIQKLKKRLKFPSDDFSETKEMFRMQKEKAEEGIKNQREEMRRLQLQIHRLNEEEKMLKQTRNQTRKKMKKSEVVPKDVVQKLDDETIKQELDEEIRNVRESHRNEKNMQSLFLDCHETFSMRDTSQKSIISLSTDVLFKIIGYLSSIDVEIFSSTCKSLFAIATENSIWEELFHRDFPRDPVELKIAQHSFLYWKRQYISRKNEAYHELDLKDGFFRLELRMKTEGIEDPFILRNIAHEHLLSKLKAKTANKNQTNQVTSLSKDIIQDKPYLLSNDNFT